MTRVLGAASQGKRVLAYSGLSDFGDRCDGAGQPSLYWLDSPAVSSLLAGRIALSDGSHMECVMQAYAQLWQEPTTIPRG